MFAGGYVSKDIKLRVSFFFFQGIRAATASPQGNAVPGPPQPGPWNWKQWFGKSPSTCIKIMTRCGKTKTTMSYHFTPIRMAIVQKTRDIQTWQGCREKGIPVHCSWECRTL